MPYPDNINFAALEAQDSRELSSHADSDLATLGMFRKRFADLQKLVEAWRPNTYHGDEADSDITDALDKALEAIGVAEQRIADDEGSFS